MWQPNRHYIFLSLHDNNDNDDNNNNKTETDSEIETDSETKSDSETQTESETDSKTESDFFSKISKIKNIFQISKKSFKIQQQKILKYF